MRSTPSSAADPGSDPSTAAAAARAAAQTPETPAGARERGQPRLFRSVWRWHFYAGLLSIPVIVLLCLSGIVYLFKPQIDAVAYGHLRDVAPREHRLTYAAQSAAVVKAYPDALITGLAPPPARDRASEFDVTTPQGRDLRVYVDPYTAKVTGDREPSRSLTTLALDLHGTLLTSRFLDEAGTWGDRVIELTASWAIVLVITGMYLWWPRGRRGFRDALRPRLRAKSSRTRWRDLHAVTGVLFGFVTLFFLITGMAWTGVWGAKFNEVAGNAGQLYPTGLYDGADSTVADTVKNGKAAWAVGDLPLADSAPPAEGGASGPVAGKVSAGGAGAADAGSGAASSGQAGTGQAGSSTANAGEGSAQSTTARREASSAGAGSPGAIPERGGRPGHTGHAGHMDAGGASSASQPRAASGEIEDPQPVGSLTGVDVAAITAGRPDVEIKSGGDGHTGHSHADSLVWDRTKGAPIDAVVGRAVQMGFPEGFTLVYPTDEYGSYTLSKFPDADVHPNATAGSERIAYVDQYTALPIRDHRFDEFGPVGKAADFGIALHEGRQWGIWSQLFSLLGTLALLLSCATAIVMWRKRKPKGLGSPRRPPGRKLGIGVVVITLALGAFFPLLGISIVALLVVDFVLVRRIPPLRRALGAGR